MLTTQWNTGDEIWFFTVIPLGVICLSLVVLAIVSAIRDWDAGDFLVPAGFVGAVVGLIIGVISIFVFWPFQTQYMQYKPVSGIVSENVTSRFLADGQGTTQNYLVVISGRDYRCDDTRCSDLKKGDTVTLMCERQWQANAVSGFVCNWGKLGLNQ